MDHIRACERRGDQSLPSAEKHGFRHGFITRSVGGFDLQLLQSRHFAGFCLIQQKASGSCGLVFE